MKVGMDHSCGDILPNKQYVERDLATKTGKDYPYKIVTDETYGRHMVAVRDIKAGEIVLTDIPLTFGPACSSGVSPVCLGCNKRVNGETVCSACNWPVCSASCQKNPIHADQECKFFQDKNILVDSSKFNYQDEEPMYSVISPIRAILLKESDPQRWSMIWSLMSHNGNRKEKNYWTEKHRRIVENIRGVLGLVEYTEQLIDTVLGIFLVNDFEINKPDAEEFGSAQRSTIRGLFSIASIPNHSCVCNTTHSFQPDKHYRMVVRASRDILAGEDITHTYVDPLEPILIRQELLNLGKFFHCQCERCSDRTELGTYSSAMVCPKCKKGYMLTSDVSTVSADWNCNLCKNTMPSQKVAKVCNALKSKAEELEYNSSKPDDCSIPAHEAFLKKYGQVLHKNHVVMVGVKYSLAKMYGRMKEYAADQLTDEQFQRKQALCEQVLAVFDVIMPGNNRMRGVMLYELHLPLVMLANRQLQKGPGSGVDPTSIKNGLKLGLDCLKKGMAILELEPEGSFEYNIVQGSKDSVAELENWHQTISKAI